MVVQAFRGAQAALQRFFQLEAAAGLLLIAAMGLALLAANTPLLGVYSAFLDLPVTLTVGNLGVDKPLLLWINDGLMAVFFLLVALELKREMLSGQFSNRAQIVLPAACAVGGLIVPALIYAGFNRGDAVALEGWAIPTATDIAFALGVLGLLGSRAPLALKVLLTAIAVLDDLAAIIIIALFYSEDLSLLSLLVSVLMLVLLVVLNRRGVSSLGPYLLVGAILWLAVLKSGVHATLAGVALGMAIPMTNSDDDNDSPLQSLEQSLHPWVAYAILPLFAFANAGLSLGGLSLDSLLAPVPLGIALGLLLGKPIGVVLAAFLVLGLGLAQRPEGIRNIHLLGLGCLCGIGFTMSLFIGSLAFEHSGNDLLAQYRLGILLGSGCAAVLGLLLLRWAASRDPLPTARA